jgi:xeroderma pigmentosum group C-complementing protein
MPPKTSTTRAKGKSKATERLVPDIYQQMLAEALPQQTDIAERPLKKRRIGPKEPSAKISSSKPIEPEEKEPEDDDLQFEDVFDVAQIETSTTQQTIYRDSEDESDVSGSDHDWEAIDFGAKLNAEEPSADLELTLTKKSVSQGKAPIQRRRAVTKDERVVRLQIHKMHVLCLLSHLDRKNNWCNDSEVQRTLKRLLDKKIIKFLTPSTDLTQFQRMNSLKRGLEDISLLWRKNYKVTARGMRRALWAENEKDLENVRISKSNKPQGAISNTLHSINH